MIDKGNRLVVPKVAVIIPYYQIKSGILRQAVQSVLDQKMISNYMIIVVDDGSPIPAKEEIGDLLEKFPEIIKAIHQRNKGAAAARNTALNNIVGDATYVAFLDSDDVWSESHLWQGINALEKGYDLYFSNFINFFDQKPHQYKCLSFNQSSMKLIDRDAECYQLTDNFFNVMIREYVVGSASSCIYRYSKFQNLRFREEFKTGEDRFFVLDIALLTNRICFSKKVTFYRGQGINLIARGTWESEYYLSVCDNQLRELKGQLALYSLSDEQKKHIMNAMDDLRSDATAYLLGRAKRFGISDRILSDCKRLFLSDLNCLMLFVPRVIRLILGKLIPVNSTH